MGIWNARESVVSDLKGLPQTNVLGAHVADNGADWVAEVLEGSDELKQQGRRDGRVERHQHRLLPRPHDGADLKSEVSLVNVYLL